MNPEDLRCGRCNERVGLSGLRYFARGRGYCGECAGVMGGEPRTTGETENSRSDG